MFMMDKDWSEDNDVTTPHDVAKEKQILQP